MSEPSSAVPIQAEQVLSSELPLVKRKETGKKIYTSLKFITLVRCIYAFLVLLYSIIWIWDDSRFYTDFYTNSLLLAVIEIFIFTTISCLALLKKRFIHAITYVGMMHDTLLAAFIVIVTGYSVSPFLYLFLIIPLYGGIILKKRGGLIGASMVCMVLLTMYFFFFPIITSIIPASIRMVLINALDKASDIRFIPLGMAAFGVGVLTGQLASMYAKAEEKLIESEKEFIHMRGVFELMLNAIPVGVLICTKISKLIVYMNPCAKQLPSELIDHFFHYIKTEKIQESPNTWLINTADKYFQVAQFPFELEQKESLVGYYVMDVTTQKQAEIEKTHRQRLELLGEFSAKVAHEIRNPLACISGCHEMLQAEAQTDEQLQIHEMMGDEIDRLNHLLGDILVFSRTPKLQFEPIVLLDLLTQQRNVFLSDPKLKELSIDIDVPKDRTFNADRASLSQIIITLWRNSAEAMNYSGHMTVSADESGNALYFKDGGPGIPEEVRGRIFEPFFTTKSNGTGLGLATAKQLATDNHLNLDWLPEQSCFILQAQ